MKPKSYRKKSSRRPDKAPKPLAPDPYATQVVENVLMELPGLLAVAVVDVASGTSLAAHTNSASINPVTAAIYNAEVVKHKQKALAALQLSDEIIEDILITLSSQLHLLKVTEDGGRFIYLAVNSHDTNLGIAREVLRAQAQQLEAHSGLAA
ncbi:hypothetical protein SAMN06265337_3266 [Hymenobacter gelipurpurascens]|uniref:Roadblock/LAMTOR2 domain-containing protein n=1 Tax=Hymenobacter gelipurpurascens TaxID=89968 RepID=A0A212UDC9_9BACT|nr:hypothetical protein [Hymenobacter gelipurpurascens]SNC76203.1 hypothetical protein SAMN06265337_3266 [Hymenobacter gelipurpurascens]